MIKSLLDDEENRLREAKSENRDEHIIETSTENSFSTEVNQTPVNTGESDTPQTTGNSFETTNTESFPDFKPEETSTVKDEKPMFQTDFKPESAAETVRKSGLAYAAGITLFASIVFLMGLGWLADLLLGTNPWGIVGGIVLGSIIGFLQFFRITSQILKNKD
jgi:F0F1-type ATP synthase assembly protein I